MAKLENKIIKSGFVNWQKLKWFQPVEIKTVDKDILKKLETSLLGNGFVQSFNIWERDGQQWILDGHIRKQAMANLLKDGHEIPDSLPADWIDVKDEKEAKKLVGIYNSHYAEINPEPMKVWLSDVPNAEIEINIPDIDFGIKPVENIQDGEVVEIPQSVQLEPPLEYIIVIAKPNSDDWENLKQMLDLKKVRRGGYKKGSAFDAMSLERVLTVPTLLERLANANSSTK